MSRRRNLFAGLTARTEDRTAEVRDVRRTGGRRGLRWGPGEKCIGCFLGDLRASGINADRWTTAAQGEGG